MPQMPECRSGSEQGYFTAQLRRKPHPASARRPSSSLSEDPRSEGQGSEPDANSATDVPDSERDEPKPHAHSSGDIEKGEAGHR